MLNIRRLRATQAVEVGRALNMTLGGTATDHHYLDAMADRDEDVPALARVVENMRRSQQMADSSPFGRGGPGSH